MVTVDGCQISLNGIDVKADNTESKTQFTIQGDDINMNGTIKGKIHLSDTNKTTNTSHNYKKHIDETDKTLRLNIQHANVVDGYVYLLSEDYYDIFGQFKKKSSDGQKRTSVIKIKADNGKKIYREYNGSGATGFKRGMIALTPNSISLLDKIKNGQTIHPKKLILSPGLYLPFYLDHPDKAIRVSFRLGILSVLLGILSLLIACFT